MLRRQTRIGSFLALAVIATLLNACATNSRRSIVFEQPTLELRSLQTRRYEIKDSHRVQKILAATLQDDHFTIRSSDTQGGLLYAEKRMDIHDDKQLRESDRLWIKVAVGVLVVGIIALMIWAISRGHSGNYCGVPGPVIVDTAGSPDSGPETLLIECTATLTASKEGTEVRLSLERRLLNTMGAVVKAEPVTEPDEYRELFAKMEKSLFLEEHGI